MLVIKFAAAALIEIVYDLFSFVLAQVVAKVDHGPTEVLSIDRFGILFIDRGKTILNSLDCALCGNETSHIGQELTNVEFLQFLDRCHAASIRRSLKEPNILVLLESGGNIRCDISVSLQSQVLSFVEASERVR